MVCDSTEAIVYLLYNSVFNLVMCDASHKKHHKRNISMDEHLSLSLNCFHFCCYVWVLYEWIVVIVALNKGGPSIFLTKKEEWGLVAADSAPTGKRADESRSGLLCGWKAGGTCSATRADFYAPNTRPSLRCQMRMSSHSVFFSFNFQQLLHLTCSTPSFNSASLHFESATRHISTFIYVHAYVFVCPAASNANKKVRPIKLNDWRAYNGARYTLIYYVLIWCVNFRKDSTHLTEP